MNVILTILYLFFTTSGLTLMKLGGDSIKLSLTGSFAFKIGYLTILGFVLYAISFLIWQKLLTIFDLNQIVPIITAIVQIIVFTIGIIVFKEKVNIYNIIGLVVLLIGILLLSYKK